MQLYYPFHKCSMFISYFEYLAPFIYFCISTTVQQHNRYLPLSLIFIDLCLAKAVHFHLANCKGNDWLIWLSKHVELRYIIWLNVNVKNESEMNYLKKKKVSAFEFHCTELLWSDFWSYFVCICVKQRLMLQCCLIGSRRVVELQLP